MLPNRETACPRCGAPNECAPARSGSFDTPCWCSAVVVDPAMLAALPDDQLGRACLCRRCVTSPSPESA
jgi:hypothetical protein